MAPDESPFLARWSRRKTESRTAAAAAAAPEPQATRLPAVADTSQRSTASAESLGSVAPAGAAGSGGPAAAAGSAGRAGPAGHIAVQAEPTTGPQLPLPTLADVAGLTIDSDFARFVTPEVAPEVRNAALKTLFGAPHFNVMDGLDTYIDDYGRPDPLPAGMLRNLVQSQLLGLFDAEPAAAPSTADPPPAALQASPPCAVTLPLETTPDEDPDLQLQPDDADRRASPRPGAVEDTGSQR